MKSRKMISKSLMRLMGLAALATIIVFRIYIPLLVIFAGLLLAVLFDAAISKLESWFKLNRKIAFLIVIFAFFGALSLFFYLALPSLGREFDQFINQLPEMFDQFRNWIDQYQWSQYIFRNFDSADPSQFIGSGEANILTAVTGFSSQVIAGVTYVLIMLFLALYLSFNPEDYRQKALSLFSRRKRKKFLGVLHESIRDLQSWLVGKFLSMMVTGTLTYISLVLLDIPAPLALAFLTALLAFIPNIGALLAGTIIALVALSKSPQTMLYVIIVLLIIEFIESYIVTPIIEKKAVSLSPAITLSTQVILGFLFGMLGVFLAAPIVVVGKVWLRER